MNGATKIVAGVLALTAFVVACIAGLGVGNSAETTLIRAVAAMFACYFAGLPLGMICEHIIEEHMREYISAHPTPGATPTGGSQRGKHEESGADVEGEAIVV